MTINAKENKLAAINALRDFTSQTFGVSAPLLASKEFIEKAVIPHQIDPVTLKGDEIRKLRAVIGTSYCGFLGYDLSTKLGLGK